MLTLPPGEVSTYEEKYTGEQAMHALDVDPLGVIIHYALTKLNEIISTLSSGKSGVMVESVFYVGKDGVLVDQWKALLQILNKGGKGDVFDHKAASKSLGVEQYNWKFGRIVYPFPGCFDGCV